jgi:predicted metal-dependent hydrolase
MGLAGRKLNIQITNMTYCLGLCYSKDLNNVNKIKFSSKLFGYNKEQIDHTIVHELAHIYHMNHKKEF